ncbi:MAG TPA: hypothetical protein VNH83_22225 [Bryobacteraceae bacterium]|nr:hypothetical protein [Bryobacteraceae bacterium]
MTDAVKTGTILIERDASMPQSLRLEGNSFSSSWRSVSNLDVNGLDTAINKAGWTFFFMAGEIKITAFGFDRERAMRRAVNRVITNAESHKCNCVEITRVSAKSFFGMPYVNVTAHSRHIQESPAFGNRRQQ